MNRLELRNSLVDRVGWKQPTTSTFTVSDENKTSESGRFFQDEHAFVKLSTIHAIMEEVGADNDNLNAYLSDLRKQVVLLVVDEVFADVDINPLTDWEIEIFDAAISKRMAMKIAEILVTSNRENLVKRISKDAMRMFFIDVSGNTERLNITKLYNRELERLRDHFNTEDNMLDVHTIGVSNYDDEDRLLWP